jgi:hypothetical protein
MKLLLPGLGTIIIDLFHLDLLEIAPTLVVPSLVVNLIVTAYVYPS